MHKNLKGLGRTLRLYDVLPHMDKTIARMRECRSISSSPVIGPHLWCLQEQIAKIFTHDTFLLLKDQIGFDSKFVIIGRDELLHHNDHSPSIDNEDSDVALSSSAESENEKSDLIDHIKDARTFEFFSRYESHLNSASDSVHYKYPNTTSNATSQAGQLSGFNRSDP
ncbi:hypothetical protein M0R45_008493 [Rubus argutus]